MACSCEGYPPSPCYGDLLGSAQDAIKKINDLQHRLNQCETENVELKRELKTLKEAYKIMGNGG